MWIVAGILLGLVVLGILAGFHVGPHAHLWTAIAGVVAALWLVIMAILGEARPLLYVLLGADLTISTLMALAAWKVLKSPVATVQKDKPVPSVEGREGIALSTLSPEGIVRVGGEQWTAVSMNGEVPVGGRVQVINANGLRLEVWREDESALPPALNDKGAGS